MYTLFLVWGVAVGFLTMFQILIRKFSFAFTFIMLFFFSLIGLAIGVSIQNPKIGEETKYHEISIVNDNYISSDGSYVTKDELRGRFDSSQIKADTLKSAPYVREDIVYYKQNKWSILTALPEIKYSLVFEISE